MFTRILCQGDGVTSRGPYIWHLIRRHCAADTGSVDDNSDVHLSTAHGFCDGVRTVRIIDSVFTFSSKIANIQAEISQKPLDPLLEFKAAVIRPDRNTANLRRTLSRLLADQLDITLVDYILSQR